MQKKNPTKTRKKKILQQVSFCIFFTVLIATLVEISRNRNTRLKNMKKFNVSTTDCQIVFLKSWKFRLPAVCGTYEHPASTQNSISTDKHTPFTIASFHVLLVTSEDKYSSCLVIKYGIIYNCMCSLPASLSIWMNSLCKKDKPRHIAENNLSILGFNLFSFYQYRC